MSNDKLLQYARDVGKLKTTPRTGWVRRQVPKYESVADHSWRVAALTLLLPETEVDIGRCLSMAVVHDLAECQVGDIAPDDGVSKVEKEKMEHQAMERLSSLLRISSLKDDKGTSQDSSLLLRLFGEYEARASPEAQAVKDLDLLDLILQADDYEQRFGIRLDDFFESTPVERFRTERVQQLARRVHEQRHERLQAAAASGDDAASTKCTSTLSKVDAAFVEEYSQASPLDAASIEHVVAALRSWEKTS